MTVIFLLIIVIILMYNFGYLSKDKEGYALAPPQYFVDNDNPYFKKNVVVRNLHPIPKGKWPRSRIWSGSNVGDSRFFNNLADDPLLSK